MTEIDPRVRMTPVELSLPACPLPRPGDSVLWYQGSIRNVGELLGHRVDDLPYVRTSRQGERQLSGFDSVRRRCPDKGIAPMWHRLPGGGLLLRPRWDEQQKLDRFLDRRIPSGITHRTIAEEIWNRGFEVFLSGVAIRDVLVNGGASDADFVTTMPIGRVHGLVVDMFGDSCVDFGVENKVWGRVRVGGVRSRLDETAEIRVFRYERPGRSDAVFGGCFERDVQHGDFACHAVYYDPVNKVFVDPTGHGLDDVVARRLRPVFDQDNTLADEQARIGLRVLGMMANKYSVAPGHEEDLTRMLRRLPAMTTDQRIDALRAEIFCTPGLDKKTLWEQVREDFAKCALEVLWKEQIEPHRGELMS